MAVRAELDEREGLVYLVRDDMPRDPERQARIMVIPLIDVPQAVADLLGILGERLPDELVGVLRPYLPQS